MSHEDVAVLYVGSGKEWKGEQIATILEQINSGNEVPYVVGDQGTNLKKAYFLRKLCAY